MANAPFDNKKMTRVGQVLFHLLFKLTISEGKTLGF
jgi:hypothetical protein